MYILKLSVSLVAIYLFYHLVLRKLTFYTWNRYYLLGYSILSLLIALINITPLLQKNLLEDNSVIKLIPHIGLYSNGLRIDQIAIAPVNPGTWNTWDWVLSVFVSGMFILSIKLLIQYFSFLKIRSKARLILQEEVKVYQVNDDIIPFSFGNSIFINQHLHSDEELKEIIRHEFVHVKQNHSIDILWSEILCVVNWYNPFAWLLRNCIRQNLEFIADQKVLENGIDRKEYQYLLLKVIGNNQFSIASKFNFSSLKKRIAMMNRMKTAKVHILKFLFVLPLAGILMVAFRNKNRESILVNQQLNNNKKIKPFTYESSHIVFSDTTPTVNTTNNVRPDHGSDDFEITDKKAVIHLRNGKTEEYDLTDSAQRQKFEKNYGKIISVGSTDETAPVAVVTAEGSKTIASVKVIDGVTAEAVAPVAVSSNAGTAVAAITVTNSSGTTVATPEVVSAGNVSVVGDYGYTITGNEDVLLTITKNTTAQQLEEFKKQMKEKGIELNFDKTTYNSKGILTYIKGTMKSADGHSNFVASDFNKLILATVKKGSRTYFKVTIEDKPKVVI
jgi:BlaR1 peptidase M56